MGRKTKTISRLGSIFLLNLGIKGLIDLPFNIYLLYEFGYKISLLATTLLYTLIGIISVKIYDYYKNDFLLIEAYKKLQENKNAQIIIENRLSKIKRWKNKNSLGIILSSQNSCLVVIYFRDGSFLYNGFAGKNIKIIFLACLLVTNIYWNSALYAGFSLWGFIFSLF